MKTEVAKSSNSPPDSGSNERQLPQPRTRGDSDQLFSPKSHLDLGHCDHSDNDSGVLGFIEPIVSVSQKFKHFPVWPVNWHLFRDLTAPERIQQAFTSGSTQQNQG